MDSVWIPEFQKKNIRMLPTRHIILMFLMKYVVEMKGFEPSTPALRMQEKLRLTAVLFTSPNDFKPCESVRIPAKRPEG